jgi:hypothetical protein
MRFEEALQAMREGKRVKLEEEPIYYIEDSTIIESWGNIGEVSTLLNPEKILAEDWEIVDE